MVVAGGSGFIGRAVAARLVASGLSVVILTRRSGVEFSNGGVRYVQWDGQTAGPWCLEVDGADAVINLAGEPITGVWTSEKRQGILASRILAGEALVEAIEASATPPKALIQASAVGFYGDRGEERLDEASPAGKGFLPSVVEAWEASTAAVGQRGVRRVVMRMAVVIGRGGFLPRAAGPFRIFLGGPLGNGRQWFPWVHIEDVAKAVEFVAGRSDLAGVFNVCAPSPIRQGEFARALGGALRRPVLCPVPAFALRLGLGAMAREVLLTSQRVYPRRLVAEGFRFGYSTIRIALDSVL